jgi:hypothetical protein
MRVSFLRVVLALFAALTLSTAFAQEYDVLIRNGHIVDGTGNPCFQGDVGIVGDRMMYIGEAAGDAKAKHDRRDGDCVCAGEWCSDSGTREDDGTNGRAADAGPGYHR